MKKKARNIINGVVALIWFISGSAVDSESWIPLIVYAICTLWLGLFLNDGTKHKGGDCHAVD